MTENNEVEIDLLDMCKYFLSKWVVILLVVLLGAGIGVGVCKITNKTVYTSEAKLYITIPKTSDKILIRDNANELVQDYIELVQSDLILTKVAAKTGLPISEIKNSVSASQVEGVRFISINTQNLKKDRCKEISDTVLRITDDTITKILKKDKPIIVQQTNNPIRENTVSMKKVVFFGAAVSFLIIIGTLFMFFMANNKTNK